MFYITSSASWCGPLTLFASCRQTCVWRNDWFQCRPLPVFYCTAFYLRVIWPLICPACHDCQWNSTNVNVNVKKSVSVTRTPTHLIRASKPFLHIPEVFPELSRLHPRFFHCHISALRFRFLRNSKGHGNARGRLGSARVVPLKRFSCDPAQTLVLESR